MAGGATGHPGFILASRSRPAFAANLPDPYEKSGSYEIFRHPAGGRRDVFHWGRPDEKPVAEFEICRPGGEFDLSQPRTADLAGAHGQRRSPGVRAGRRHLKQIRQHRTVSPSRTFRPGEVLPRLAPAFRRSGAANLGMVMRELAGATCGHCLQARPADHAGIRKRAAAGRAVCPCGTETRRFRKPPCGLARLGHGYGKSASARRAIGRPSLPRDWFSCNFFVAPQLYSRQLWPI